MTRRLVLVVVLLLGAVVNVWGMATGRWWVQVIGIGIALLAAVYLVGPWAERRRLARRDQDAPTSSAS